MTVKLAKVTAKPAKAAAKPVKAAAKPARMAAKPAKAVAGETAVSSKAVAAAAPAAAAADQVSEYAIEPDDPQLMAKLKAHLRAKDMQTEQFAMVQKALKELAAHQDNRADQGKGTLQP